MMRIDESIIFFETERRSIVNLYKGGYIVVILYICICNVNEYFLQGKRQKVSLP